AEQGQPEEQVVVQEILVPGVLRCMQPAAERLLRDRAGRREELVVREKGDQLLYLVWRRPERGFGADARYQRCRVTVLAPAREQLELEPADFEERVADRVENAPRRRTVALRRSGIQAQVLPDRRQRNRFVTGR